MGIFNFGGSETSSGVLESCYSLSEIPGKKIAKSFGLVFYTQKNLAGNIPKKTRDIFFGLQEAAKELGANAIINVRLTSGSYFAQGSGWEVSYVIACGDAVVLIDES